MIIQIVGTSGAGKTTLVRRLIAQSRYAATITMPTITKRNPGELEIGRIVHLGERSIFIAGRYDADLGSGGCDCIKDVKFWFDTAWEQAQTHDVVFEGLFVMNHTRGLTLTNLCTQRSIPFHVIHLTTPVAVCKASINERRAQRGQEPFARSWDNFDNNIIRARNFSYKVKQIGAQVHALDRDAAVQRLMELLR